MNEVLELQQLLGAKEVELNRLRSLSQQVQQGLANIRKVISEEPEAKENPSTSIFDVVASIIERQRKEISALKETTK